MTKKLLIMRHAKSSWADESLTDHQRPLNKRGNRDAPRMAQFIADQGLLPDEVVSSTAVRAKTTAQMFVENCPGIRCEVELEDDFYHAPPRVYLERLLEAQDDTETLMFVGHNPGMEELVRMLSGEWETMPTAAIAYFEIEISEWSDFSKSSEAKLIHVWRPKEIG